MNVCNVMYVCNEFIVMNSEATLWKIKGFFFGLQEENKLSFSNVGSDAPTVVPFPWNCPCRW